jgi:hypothetical protein
MEHAPGVEVRWLGPQRGRGLVATRAFASGEVVLRERPLCAVQDPNNGVLGCAACLRPVGSLVGSCPTSLISRLYARLYLLAAVPNALVMNPPLYEGGAHPRAEHIYTRTW